MKKQATTMAVALAIGAALLTPAGSGAQDPAAKDPEAYTVEFENESVRILRIRYEPGHKSVMHSHAAGVAVFLSDGKGRFAYPDGTTEEISFEAGQTLWLPAVTHQPENVGEEPFELIQIEIKGLESGNPDESDDS